MTMALSYDPFTRITTGFLGGQLDSADHGPIMELRDQLRKVAAFAIQPMLLPVMAYGIWCDRLRIQMVDAGRDILMIQKRTGLMDGIMTSSMQNAVARAKPGEYNIVHEDLVQAHASLTSGLSRFVEDLGIRCEQALDHFHQITEGTLKTSSKFAIVSLTKDQRRSSEVALRSYLGCWLLTAKVAFQERDKQLARAEMQIKVVRHLPQFRSSRFTPTLLPDLSFSSK